MHALILAGGAGARLRADGVTTPKAFVEIAGRPLVFRLADNLRALGCGSITVAIRRDALAQAGLRSREREAIGLRYVPCETPSSLHSLALGLEAVPPGPLVCTMVDSVMREEDWQRLFLSGGRFLQEGADACIAVTPSLTDEHSLYVARHAGGSVAAFHAQPVSPPLVTGGVYFLSSRIRELAPRVLSLGIARMRGFMAWLVDHGYRVETSEVPRIVDLDRGSDLAAAEGWLGAATPENWDTGTA